jgi:hypothetical protein
MAIISALTGRAVRSDVAMTGEITLRGRVMPVGGVKEKLLAAHRAGLKRFILPRKNLPDLEEVPGEIRESLHIIPVDHLDQVMQLVLGPRQSAAQPALAGVVTDISTAGAEHPTRTKPALMPDVADDPIDEVARPADKPNPLPVTPPRDPQPVTPRPMVGVN